MRIYTNQTVLEAAKDRLRWLFREFEHVYINTSGGKDSTVVVNLALEVAEEVGRLPLNVFFLDQEAEWQCVIDYIRTVMTDPRVRPFWLQVPFLLRNSTCETDPWLRVWNPDDEAGWLRPKEAISIHENIFAEDRFAHMFSAFKRARHPTEPAISVSGVRCEESPARLLGLTTYATYKGETWGSVEDKKRRHFSFYPIYDWAFSDVWKAIHDNHWNYTRLYDFQYQYGIAPRDMRVSNLHHETALRNMFYMQEVEPETWEKLSARLHGVKAAAQMAEAFYAPRDLPSMFANWTEYRDHLLENLIENKETREKFRGLFVMNDARYEGTALAALIKTEIGMILTNDLDGSKLTTFYAAHFRDSKNRGARSGRTSYTPDAT